MINEEQQQFKDFEADFSYEWYGNADNANDTTVLFRFWDKDMYKKPKSEWKPKVEFEALNLEDAFDYAFKIVFMRKIGIIKNMEFNPKSNKLCESMKEEFTKFGKLRGQLIYKTTANYEATN